MKCRLITIRKDHAPVFSDFDSSALAEAAARPLHDAGHKVCGVDLSCGEMTDFSKRFRQQDARVEEGRHRKSAAAFEQYVNSLPEEQIVQMGIDCAREPHNATRRPEPLHWRVKQRLDGIRKREADSQKWVDAMERFLINARVDNAPVPAPVLQASDADTPFRLFLVWAGAMALVCLGIVVLA